MTPTIQAVRALREEIKLEAEEDCIAVNCRQMNPEKVHAELLSMRVTDIVELSGLCFQIMCDPYDAGVQQLQIRPKPRSWSLQHDEFEYALQTRIWISICKADGRREPVTNRQVTFIGHETQIAVENATVLNSFVQIFNRIFPSHQPIYIVTTPVGNLKWVIARSADESATGPIST